MKDTYVLLKNRDRLLIIPAPTINMYAKTNATVGDRTSPEIRKQLEQFAAIANPEGWDHNHLLEIETKEDFRSLEDLTVLSFRVLKSR